MNITLIKEVLRAERSSLEDDAYRYEHFGTTKEDKLTAAKRRLKMAEIDVALGKL